MKLGLVGGIVADERGNRLVGVVGVSAGFVTLLIAYFYT